MIKKVCIGLGQDAAAKSPIDTSDLKSTHQGLQPISVVKGSFNKTGVYLFSCLELFEILLLLDQVSHPSTTLLNSVSCKREGVAFECFHR